MSLNIAQITVLVGANNNSPFSGELVTAVCWAESGFDPMAVAGGTSTSAGLMMMNHPAIDTVNSNTPAGTHYNYTDMLDPAMAVAAGTYYLQIIYNNEGAGDKRETLRHYRGVADYAYADKIIACEACLQAVVVVDPQTCLNQIHV